MEIIELKRTTYGHMRSRPRNADSLRGAASELTHHGFRAPFLVICTMSSTLVLARRLLQRQSAEIVRCFSSRNHISPSLPRPILRPLQKDDGSRPHAITLFPGDYQDDELDEMMMDEDDDDGMEDELSEVELLQQVVQRREIMDQANKARWKRNSEPQVRHVQIDDRGRSYGRGARKTASARVWIQPGMGTVVVNRQDWVDYFPRMTDRDAILQPMVVTGTCGALDVKATVRGGGLTGQAGAIRLGLARALQHYNPQAYRPVLKQLGYLTRDARKVERKKVGKVKARKSPQWVRR